MKKLLIYNFILLSLLFCNLNTDNSIQAYANTKTNVVEETEDNGKIHWTKVVIGGIVLCGALDVFFNNKGGKDNDQ